ncbi:MAG: hypothetical protein R2787_02735 [Saprospiraceae bacterium]
MKKRNDSKSSSIIWIGVVVLVIGALLMFLAPQILLDIASFAANQRSAHIGDTIGGTTAPIINLVGAILVFLAFIAQVEANRSINEQFRQERQLNHLDSLIAQFKQGLKDIKVKESQGLSAIAKIEKELTMNLVPKPDFEAYKTYDYLAYLASTLKLGVYILQRIKDGSLEEEDQEVCFQAVKHEYEFKLNESIEKIAQHENCPHGLKKVIDEFLILIHKDQSWN